MEKNQDYPDFVHSEDEDNIQIKDMNEIDHDFDEIGLNDLIEEKC